MVRERQIARKAEIDRKKARVRERKREKRHKISTVTTLSVGES